MTLEKECIENMKQLITGILIDTEHPDDRTPHALGMRSAAVEMEWVVKNYKKLKKNQEKT